MDGVGKIMKKQNISPENGKKPQHPRRAAKIVLPAILAALILGSIGCYCYLTDFYEATDEVDTYLQQCKAVSVTAIEDGLFLDGAGTENALIFYPGAKVEYTAYLPLLCRLAENGVDVFLLKMPCNLAIFGIHRAETILSQYSYAHWYLGGHSLGGAVAAMCVSSGLESGKSDFDGLVLLAAYSTKDLSGTELRVLTVYGSEDQVLNMDQLASCRANLPAAAEELKIEGGNHAQFGCYGAQKGDGTATISASEQWDKTVNAIVEMIMKQER